MGIFNKTNNNARDINYVTAYNKFDASDALTNSLSTAQALTSNIQSALGNYTIAIDPSTYSYSWNSIYNDDSKFINQTIGKLPTLLKITKAIFEKNRLSIKYERILDKYLPDNGTLYFPKLDLYCTFNTTDDKYWYKRLDLTCNLNELDKNKVDKLNNSYCILLNDFDTKLDNTELIELADPQAYKDYAHWTLEQIYYEESVKTLKPERNNMHSRLEEKLKSLHD